MGALSKILMAEFDWFQMQFWALSVTVACTVSEIITVEVQNSTYLSIPHWFSQ